MRYFRIHVDTPYAGISETEDFEMPDDATEEEIANEAKEIFFNIFNYGFEELEERGAE